MASLSDTNPYSPESIFSAVLDQGGMHAAGERQQRLGGMPTRPQPDRAATMRLALRAGIAVWALLVFVLLCVVAARSGSAPQPSKECDDSNPCTRDFKMQGACLNLPLVDGSPCLPGACYAPSAKPTGVCLAGTCKGDTCAGSCQRSSDCPALQIKGKTLHGSCTWGVCLFQEQSVLAVATSGGCAAPIFSSMCESLLSPTDVYAPCIVVSPTCDSGSLTCTYSFSCVSPRAPMN